MEKLRYYRSSVNNVGSNIPVQRVHGSPRFVVIELSLNTDSQSCDRNFWKGRIIGKSMKETGIELRNILIPLERSFPPSARETRLFRCESGKGSHEYIV